MASELSGLLASSDARLSAERLWVCLQIRISRAALGNTQEMCACVSRIFRAIIVCMQTGNESNCLERVCVVNTWLVNFKYTEIHHCLRFVYTILILHCRILIVSMSDPHCSLFWPRTAHLDRRRPSDWQLNRPITVHLQSCAILALVYL